ncbi:MAG: hypothetical protein PWP31_1729 [Clostridia bacterium]|nr:hypothetical protein [Clostridia bacterium]
MKKWITQRLWYYLNCLVPIYGTGNDTGNYTEVWLDNGEKIVDKRRVKTVVRSLASYLGVSWQQQYTAWIQEGHSHPAPLVLGPDMVLIPLRLRRPRSRDEGGTGYVVGSKVIRCEPFLEGPYRSRLVLQGNQILPCLLSLDTLELRLLAGQKALNQRLETYRELAAAGTLYEHKSHLLVEPNGSATPVRILEREGNLIVLRQENRKSLLY